MTTPTTQDELAKRRAKKSVATTIVDHEIASIAALLEDITHITFPSPRYRDDPVAFCRDILGFDPWHRQIETMEAVRDHGRVAVRSGHKTGKALHNNTLVPTTRGWSYHGDLVVGDQVFDEHGKICNVVAVIPWAQRPLMRVTFDDGTHVDSDENHEWLVRAIDNDSLHRKSFNKVAIETKQIAASLSASTLLRGHRFKIDMFNVGRLKRLLYGRHVARPRMSMTIVSVEPIPGLHDVQCIEVDSPSHLYLCGESMVPTHNSRGASALALWFFCSYDSARVTMTSTTARQVDQILWREIKMLIGKGAKCLACKAVDPRDLTITRPCPHSARIDGTLGDLARTGLKTRDFREIVGFTAREAEAVAGISGTNLLYIVDEASGVARDIFEAIEGNRAGGARIVLLGNPTNNDGEFYEAFHAKRDLYRTITVSSEETPNVIEGRDVVPGLAYRAWIDEKKEEWGEGSAQYKIRVKGEHALHEDGKVFSIHAIVQAEQRWHEAPELGRLFIGVDPAGESGTGDDSCFALRRGKKILRIVHMTGLTPDAHVVHTVGMLDAHALRREVPVVVLDALGSVGTKVRDAFRSNLEKHPGSYELACVRSSDQAVRKPQIYGRLRDELAANLEAWLRDGGAIPEDAKLAAELHELQWKMSVQGKLKLTPKDELRKRLGRSPDRYDAVVLAAWEPLALQDTAGLPESVRAVVEHEAGPAVAMDPYAGSDAWK